MRLKYFSILAFMCCLQVAIAQRTVKGVVNDATSGEPLIGATVSVPGTSTGVVTDIDGTFLIKVPTDAQTLNVSYTGYATQEVTIAGLDNVTIALMAGVDINEVVVTALGVTRAKDELTYASQTVKSKDLNISRVGDVSRQLRGLVPGLSVSTNGGSGVSSSRIVLRGESSLNLGNNEPLIIVDGVPISNDFNGVKGGNSRTNQPIDYGNGLTDINPDDIQDISVLKGPKAAALYGTRAANGALVITTTNGKHKKGVGVTFTTGIAFDEVTRFWDVQNEYSGGWYSGDYGYANFGGWGLPLDGRLQVQPYVDYGQLPAPEATPLQSRFKSEDFFETGISYNNHLALSFNGENIYGRVSFSHQDKTGIVPNTGYERTGISTRFGANLTDKLTLDVSASYVNSGSDNVPVMGIGDDSREGLMYALIWAPNNIDMDAYKDNYWFFNSTGVRTQRSIPGWITNPHIITQENLNSFDRNRIFGNIKLSYQINENLSAFVRTGTDRYDDSRNSRRPRGQSYFANGMYREQDITFSEVNTDFLLTYNNTFDKIGLNVNVGVNNMRQQSSDFQVRVDQLDILDVYNFGNALDRPVIVEADAEKVINSVYGSVLLDYEKKVFLDITGRNDWSSTLADGNNSFFYPSIGLSAIVSKLTEMPDEISFLQVRTSLAQTGNDTDPQLINATYAYGTLPGSAVNQTLIVDPNLKPERTTAFEIGFDLRLFDYKVGLEMNYYRNSTEDQILRAPISPASGAAVQLFNAGLVRNSGVEILLKGKIAQTKDFTWDAVLTWARNTGEVVELADGIESLILAQGPTLPGIIIQAVPGGQMGDIYGKDYQRHNGEIIWSDVNGLATATYDTELKNVGNYNPDWISALISDLNYKGINFRIVGEYRNGGALFTETGSRLMQAGKDTETLDRTTTPTVVPAGVMSDGGTGFVTNTISLPYFNYARRSRHWENAALNTFDATFFKLREVAIGVDLAKYVKGVELSKLMVSIFGRNLYTWTKSEELRHFDPESFMFNQGILVPGVESGQLPSPTTYGFNISVGF